MAASRALRSADELISPALAETVAALGPPEADAALVRLTAVVASSIDHMSPAVRDAMLGQTAPLLLRCLVELDKRAARRQQGAGRGAGWLQQMREQHAAVHDPLEQLRRSRRT